jgi:hypothetical protein
LVSIFALTLQLLAGNARGQPRFISIPDRFRRLSGHPFERKGGASSLGELAILILAKSMPS